MRANISEATPRKNLVLPLRATFFLRLLPSPSRTPDEPESFFFGDTPSSEDDPFGWGGDFDQDHRATSDQRLPLSPDKRVETSQMDFRLSGDHASAIRWRMPCSPYVRQERRKSLVALSNGQRAVKATLKSMMWLL